MRSILYLFLALSWPSLAFSQVFSRQTILPVDSQVIVKALSNGLRYYIRHNEKPERTAELRLVIHAGSILENDDQQGLAHFVEHMAFNGTTHFPTLELVNFLERNGVRFGPHLNAYTSFDETVYMLQIPTDSNTVVETSFQILEDWAQNISFEPEEIDKERGVVGEEWRLGLGAYERVNAVHYPTIFVGSQYARRLPIGKKEVIDTAHYATLKQFYRDWYRPDLMAVIAVGDFNIDTIEGFIVKYFGQIGTRENPRKREEFSLSGHEKTLVSIATDKELPYSTVQILFKQNEQVETTVEDYRQSILHQLYDGMFNDRIAELLQQPDPPFIYAGGGYGHYIGKKDALTLFMMGKENSIERGIQSLLTEIYRVQQHGFTSTELERQKSEILRRMEKAYEEKNKTESDNFADEYIRNYLEKEPIPGITFEYSIYQAYLPEITVEEVNMLSQSMLRNTERCIIVSLPEKEGITVPKDTVLSAMMDSIAQATISPYKDVVSTSSLMETKPKGGSIVASKHMKSINVTEFTLSNGIKVFVKPTQFKNDEVLLTATSPGGNSLIPEKDYDKITSGVSSIVAMGGISDFDAIQLQKMLAGKIVNVSPYIGELTEGFSASASPKDLETMFQLIYLRATAPRKDSTVFLSYQNRYKAMIRSRSLSPESPYNDTIAVTVANYHHRSRPVTEALLDSINLDKAFTFYKQRYADMGDFTFFIVGSFSIDSVKPLIEQYLGALPSKGRKEQWKDVGIRYPKGFIRKVVAKGIEQKSSVQMTYTGEFRWDRKERYLFTSMLEVLRIKLREQLREEKGGVYGVSVSGIPSQYPIKKYSINIRFGCSPDRIEELISAVKTQIDSLKSFPVASDYILKVKELQRRDHELQLQDNDYWLSYLSSTYFNKEDPQNILKFNKLIESLQANDILKAAKKYFGTKNRYEFILNPE